MVWSQQLCMVDTACAWWFGQISCLCMGSKSLAAPKCCCSVNSRTSPSVDGGLFYICRRKKNRGEHVAKVVTTKEEAHKIFTDLHSSDIGAHCGIDKTHHAIIQRFYWPGMEGDIRKWVSEYSTIPLIFSLTTYNPLNDYHVAMWLLASMIQAQYCGHYDMRTCGITLFPFIWQISQCQSARQGGSASKKSPNITQ